MQSVYPTAHCQVMDEGVRLLMQASEVGVTARRTLHVRHFQHPVWSSAKPDHSETRETFPMHFLD